MGSQYTNSTNLTYIVSTSMGASINGDAVPKELQTGIFVQAVVSSGSSPVGDLKLQCSNDGSTWTDVASSSQAVSANGSFVWNVDGAFYRFFRLVYTRTSGSATLNASYHMI